MTKSKIVISIIALGVSISAYSAAKPVMAFAGEGNAEKGKALYESEELKCAACHGESGQGDGKKSKKLKPKATDFTDPKTWTKSDKTPDLEPEARMRKSTLEGGPSVKQSKAMDAYKDITPEQMDDLMAYIRTFKK